MLSHGEKIFFRVHLEKCSIGPKWCKNPPPPPVGESWGSSPVWLLEYYTMLLMIHSWRIVTENCVWRKILKCCAWRLILKHCAWHVISKHCARRPPDATLRKSENCTWRKILKCCAWSLILKHCAWRVVSKHCAKRSPDATFQNIASDARQTPDVTFRNQASGTRFQNHAPGIIFCDHASDVQYESGYVGWLGIGREWSDLGMGGQPKSEHCSELQICMEYWTTPNLVW